MTVIDESYAARSEPTARYQFIIETLREFDMEYFAVYMKIVNSLIKQGFYATSITPRSEWLEAAIEAMQEAGVPVASINNNTISDGLW